MSGFREQIEDGRVHLLDGAMGTELYGRGYFVNVCYDELNLTEPQLVLEVHREYVRAGAEALETNTFGANPVKLSAWGLEDRTEEINRTAAELARQAADATGGDPDREGRSGEDGESATDDGNEGDERSGEGGGGEGDERGERRVAVLGAVGPLGIRIEPFGPTSEEEARAYFRRQIEGLVAGGVDGFVLETFTDLGEIHQALRAAREVAPDLPVMAQMTVSEEGATAYGTTVEQIASALTEWEADVVGLNCSVGPASMLEAVERMARATDVPLSAQPNAGMPRTVGDRKIYLASPDYMAQYARRLVEAGARFVGGCCGTSPEHIDRMREVVSSLEPKIPHVRVRGVEAEGGREVEPVALAERSEWGRKLAGGGWLTTVEVHPPRGWQIEEMVACARKARDAGVDAVYLAETSRGQSRMGVIPAATVIQSRAEMETIVHYTCRDRNMLGMISDLLGAAAAGLRNVAVVSGDPTVTGPYRDATTVFDIDSIGLVNVLQGLNRGVDPGGSPIDAPTRWVVGVSVNPGAVDRERELERWYWKVDAGADFAVSHPVFDPAILTEFLEGSRASRIPIVARVPLFTTSRDVEFLANEVPGTAVPESAAERMREAESRGPGAVRAQGIAIARETVNALRGTVRGVQVTVDGDVDAALEVLEG